MGDKPSPSPAATSSPGRGKSFEGKPLVKRSGKPLPAAPIGCASCSPFCRLVATSSPGRGKSFHSGGGLGKEGRFRPQSLTMGRNLLLSCKLFALAKASPFRERWHGEAVTERVSSGTNPLSLAALDSSFPFLSPTGDIFPRPGEVFRRASPWQRGQVSSSFVNGRKNPTVKL